MAGRGSMFRAKHFLIFFGGSAASHLWVRFA